VNTKQTTEKKTRRVARKQNFN